MKRFLLAVVVLLSISALGQTINSSQYQVELNFVEAGPYGQSQALDVTFGEQFTTNNRLQGDFITMPGANYTGYLGGDSWNLSVLCPFFAATSLPCGKFMPFVTGEAGLGRIQVGNAAASQAFAAIAEVGAGYDLTGKGNYGLLFKAGWGHFGPSVQGESNNGFLFYSGIQWGGGSNAEATAAKIAHIKQAEAKRMKKLQERAARAARG